MSQHPQHDDPDQLRYLRLLSQSFPTRQAAFTEIINLEAILNLPKGTEHFLSDVHGEYEAFEHILNNCSGVIRERVDALFAGELDAAERADLCTLIYYPRQKLRQLHARQTLDGNWYEAQLLLLVRLARTLSGLYTRSKVRCAMPVDYAYIIDELLHASAAGETSRHEYHVQIIRSVVGTGAADHFIRSLAALIKRLAVDHLHLIGDIFDRGAHADKIMDRLMEYHSLDIQWGNHDICWMGAAAGSQACIAAVVRTNVRYRSFDMLERAYGISLRNLALFAERTYRPDGGISPMEKAISVILFKVEGQLILRHPDFDMTSRLLLGQMDLAGGTVHVGGRDLPLFSTDFPTVDPERPYELSAEEGDVLAELEQAFSQSERLRRHVGFLYERGSVYQVSNGNLLFHGCIPLEADGTFSTVICEGYPYSGRGFMDFCDRIARRAWNVGDQMALDWMWYLWCGKHSPLSGRVVKTFERSFVKDRSSWAEPQDPYFTATRLGAVCEEILEEFGLDDEHSHIINGHKPVKAIDGESPIKGEGRLLVIDGGFCEAYHKTTGIAGYTLISADDGMRIKAHLPFMGVDAALGDNADILSESTTIEREVPHLKIKDTDTGDDIRTQIADLRALLDAYRCGTLKERS
ncbi:fructose-bisphosphatase class III [Olsenella sp. HMSC062G07]|uniref:fructose-bisphosphatase class III n=1 Tax=Olsenella sp. HMSC062G07 TaxID=1739330 RepID=UPI0008A21395|nr:fructose-bisphosphatase class III [Olsenella sp. HMSC062G07]OFK24604.1 fructose 1,6-bisphosphatase [Olsenella sp. HMSC062G07]